MFQHLLQPNKEDLVGDSSSFFFTPTLCILVDLTDGRTGLGLGLLSFGRRVRQVSRLEAELHDQASAGGDVTTRLRAGERDGVVGPNPYCPVNIPKKTLDLSNRLQCGNHPPSQVFTA